MGLNIPNVSEVVYPAQGYPDDCDFQIMRAQAQGTGCLAATAHPNFSGVPSVSIVSGFQLQVSLTTICQVWTPVVFAGAASVTLCGKPGSICDWSAPTVPPVDPDPSA